MVIRQSPAPGVKAPRESLVVEVEKYSEANGGATVPYRRLVSWIYERSADSISASEAPLSDDAVARDFDFLIGDWRVHHRRRRRDGAGLEEFEGTASHRSVMDGAANVEEHVLNAPGRPYRAVALRARAASTGQWAIWWLDGRYPSAPLDPPVVGGFDNGVGHFYSDHVEDDRPMRVRFRWSDITATSARWEQSYSSDGGETWTSDWVMKFQRIGSDPALIAAGQDGPSDFGFLDGEWRVRHRLLRAMGGQEWVDAEGTVSHSPLMGGRANLEEHTIDMPSGRNRALALRSYDPGTSEWSIWWLDGRDPHGPLDPPVRGRFTDGVGTFHGDSTVDGRPIRVRYVWSDTTTTSPRWEQAYRPDEGSPWEPNWIMKFHR